MAKSKKVTECTDQELLAELSRRRSAREFKEGMTLSEMERSVEQFKFESGSPALEELVRRMKPESGRAKRCPKCNKLVPVKAKDRQRTVLTLSGPLVLKRNYHYCDSCKLGFHPVDDMLGLPAEGDLSPELDKRVSDFALNDVFDQVAKRWSIHYSFSISDNLARGAIDRLGTALEESDPLYVQTALRPKPEEPAHVLYAMTDGGMLPVREGDGWKEAKVGVVFRDDRHLGATHDKWRGQISEARYATSMEGPASFEHEMTAVLQAEMAKAARAVVWLGDGAPCNWHLAQKLHPGCTEILDWSHVVEHGMNLAKAIFGEEDPCLAVWKQRIEELLFAGDNNALVRELMDCLGTCDEEGSWLLSDGAVAALNDEVRYFRNNAARMRYREFRDAGLLIGSGPVESAHRHVLQVRMKRAGQHWSIAKANRMAKLRAAYRTSPERFYEAIRHAHWRTRTQPIKQRASTRRRASNQ
jgi:hypothetical protein